MSSQPTPGNTPIQEISLIQKFQNQMKVIQEKTGFKGIYVVCFLIVCVVLVYFNIFDSLITNVVGTAYPIFYTIKSIEENSDELQKNWLTYWVVFGSFTIVDLFSPIIIKFVPFYFVMKILFLIWLEMPGSSGCKIVYHLLIKKIFAAFQEDIDKYVDDVKNIIDESIFTEENKKFVKGIKKGFEKLTARKVQNVKIEEAVKAAEELKKEKEREESGEGRSYVRSEEVKFDGEREKLKVD